MKNEKLFLFSLLLAIFLFLLLVPVVSAESSYVLPYPSAMPGSKFYLLQQIKDTALQYWYFGNFGQFAYNLKQSDKYLVEAKTLFEYRQYLLGYEALKKSDLYFIHTLPYLRKAQNENKNINQSRLVLKEAALKHIEVLAKLGLELPKTFVWQPEKSLPTKLDLKNAVDQSIIIRKKHL